MYVFLYPLFFTIFFLIFIIILYINNRSSLILATQINNFIIKEKKFFYCLLDLENYKVTICRNNNYYIYSEISQDELYKEVVSFAIAEPGQVTKIIFNHWKISLSKYDHKNLLVILENVKDQVSLEKALRASECKINDLSGQNKEYMSEIRMYNDFLLESSHAIAIYNSSQKLIFYNDVFMKFWDFKPEFLNSAPYFSDILHKLILNKKITVLDTAFYAQVQKNFFYNLAEPHNEFIYLPDGRSVRILITPNFGSGLMFSYEDISDRLNNQMQLTTVSQMNDEIFEIFEYPVAIFNAYGILINCNNLFSRFLNIDKTNLQSQYISIISLGQILSSLIDGFDPLIYKQMINDDHSSNINNGDNILIKETNVKTISCAKYNVRFIKLNKSLSVINIISN